MCCKYIYISHVGILGVKQIFRWYKKGTIRTEAGICLKGIQYKQNYKSFARIVLIVRNCMQSLQHRANSTIDPIRSSLIVKVSHISSSTSDDFIARFLSWKNPKNPLHLSIGISHQVAQHMYIHIYMLQQASQCRRKRSWWSMNPIKVIYGTGLHFFHMQQQLKMLKQTRHHHTKSHVVPSCPLAKSPCQPLSSLDGPGMLGEVSLRKKQEHTLTWIKSKNRCR